MSSTANELDDADTGPPSNREATEQVLQHAGSPQQALAAAGNAHKHYRLNFVLALSTIDLVEGKRSNKYEEEVRANNFTFSFPSHVLSS